MSDGPYILRIRELENQIKAEIGVLTTPTGLVGRDADSQVQEYARRVQGVAERLEDVLGRWK